MGSYRVDWVNDHRDDYNTEEEYIDAYPDNPCPNCGQPEVGEDCQSCDMNKPNSPIITARLTTVLPDSANTTHLAVSATERKECQLT